MWWDGQNLDSARFVPWVGLDRDNARAVNSRRLLGGTRRFSFDDWARTTMDVLDTATNTVSLRAGNTTFPNLTATFRYAVIFKDSGTASTSPPLGFNVPATAIASSGQNAVTPVKPRPVSSMSTLAPNSTRFGLSLRPNRPTPSVSAAEPSSVPVCPISTYRNGGESRDVVPIAPNLQAFPRLP